MIFNLLGIVLRILLHFDLWEIHTEFVELLMPAQLSSNSLFTVFPKVILHVLNSPINLEEIR